MRQNGKELPRSKVLIKRIITLSLTSVTKLPSRSNQFFESTIVGRLNGINGFYSLRLTIRARKHGTDHVGELTL
jgi:hypothetical protein